MIKLQAPANIIASTELQQMLGYEHHPNRVLTPDDAVYILSVDEFPASAARLVIENAALILLHAAYESQLRAAQQPA